MKKTIILILLLITTFLFANTTPEVSNITASQRTDGSGIVDIYYDVSDADGDTLTITLQLFEDSGNTFTIIPIHTSGEIGSGIFSGIDKQIIWEAFDEDYTLGNSQYQFKVFADDGYTGGSGTVIDIDGNVYQTVQIGEQMWMAENLKVTHYQNGNAIPNVTDENQWINLSTGAYCVYNNTPANAETYGNLYNWYAVDDSRNIAPAGWHVPTDEEIMELEMYLGMSYSEAQNGGPRGTNEGSKLAGRADLWIDGELDYDPEFGSSGFDLLPGGYRIPYNGFYTTWLYNTYLWSSTESNNDNAWLRGLKYDGTGVYRGNTLKGMGISIRCVRD